MANIGPDIATINKKPECYIPNGHFSNQIIDSATFSIKITIAEETINNFLKLFISYMQKKKSSNFLKQSQYSITRANDWCYYNEQIATFTFKCSEFN